LGGGEEKEEEEEGGGVVHGGDYVFFEQESNSGLVRFEEERAHEVSLSFSSSSPTDCPMPCSLPLRT
jgi:hypothetical protein